jgi:hypothetical protein
MLMAISTFPWQASSICFAVSFDAPVTVQNCSTAVFDGFPLLVFEAIPVNEGYI